jgi:hypothetical protein
MAEKDPILGGGSVALAPSVTLVSPAIAAVGVSVSAPAISATFSEPVTALTGGASFVLTCAAPCVNPAGTVALNPAGTVATFTPAASLDALTVYTATVTAVRSAATGLVMAIPYSWTFTTGALPDTTRPRVTATVPVTVIPGPSSLPINASIAAVFTESMASSTVTAAGTFTVTCSAPCVSPAGSVSYGAGSSTAVFTPSAALALGATYTARITTAATDIAGNALGGNQATLPAASDYVWSFTTTAAATAANVSVLSTSPAASASGVCPSSTANATFSVPSGLRMDPATINATTFRITGPAPALTPVLAASIALDAATGQVATFRPQIAFTNGTTYTATITGGSTGVKDLAIPGNAMVGNFTWTFTAGPATGSCVAPPSLGSVAPFGTLGGSAGMTNTGILTVINGDIGTIATGTSSITGFHDTAGDIYTQSPANMGTVNGKIYSCTNSTTGPTSAGPNAAACNVATLARLDAQTAYLALAAMPSGANPGGNLAGLTLTPGVYTAPAGSFLIQGGNLTLDAQGNANAVFVFQMATTLTVGGPGAAAPQSVILAGGAQAKNIFWQVGTAATINAGGGGTMVGTIISQAGAAFSTLGNTAVVTLQGRALSLGASVTVVNTVINVPAP